MTALPDWLTPMAATLTEERFSGPAWRFERKFDGIRLVAFRDGHDVTLFSRNHLAQDVPAIADAVARLPLASAILDGELLWDRSAYHVFDVLWLDGLDLRKRPLEERVARLDALPLAPPLFHVAPLDGERPWERACAEGWEGVIAKRRDSIYEHDLPRKIIHWVRPEVLVQVAFIEWTDNDKLRHPRLLAVQGS